MLVTIEVCKRAKALLDPSADGGVKEEDYDKAPGGCSLFEKKWYFNTAEGQPDGETEPVCKLTPG